MKPLNRDVPLEKFEIGFPEEVLQSPQLKAKLVTIMRFASQISEEITGFELQMPDVLAIRLRPMRSYEDADYLLNLRNDLDDFIDKTERTWYKYIGKALRGDIPTDVYKAINSCLEKQLRTNLKNLERLSKAAGSKLSKVKRSARGLEDDGEEGAIQMRDSFNDRYRELVF